LPMGRASSQLPLNACLQWNDMHAMFSATLDIIEQAEYFTQEWLASLLGPFSGPSVPPTKILVSH